MAPIAKVPTYISALLLVGLLGFAFLLTSCSAVSSGPESSYLKQLTDQAFAGDRESQYLLGIHYSLNNQQSIDKSRGYNWFLEAAEAGHRDAQYMVGMGKLLGLGTIIDREEAQIWLSRAAEHGHSRSQYQLGQFYLNGNGVEKDPYMGRYWLEQAANSNHPEAQFLLAALFKQGIGGQINRPEAWRWLKRAEYNKHQYAPLALKKLTHELSADEQETARRLLNQTEDRDSQGLYIRPKVRYLQSMLNQRGFSSIVEDGQYGPLTRKAVEKYLRQKNMPLNTSIDLLIRHLSGKN
jgi:TPR repeat protein